MDELELIQSPVTVRASGSQSRQRERSIALETRKHVRHPISPNGYFLEALYRRRRFGGVQDSAGRRGQELLESIGFCFILITGLNGIHTACSAIGNFFTEP